MVNLTKHLFSIVTSFPFLNHAIRYGWGCFSHYKPTFSTISLETIFSQLPPSLITWHTFPPKVHLVLKMLVRSHEFLELFAGVSFFSGMIIDLLIMRFSPMFGEASFSSYFVCIKFTLVCPPCIIFGMLQFKHSKALCPSSLHLNKRKGLLWFFHHFLLPYPHPLWKPFPLSGFWDSCWVSIALLKPKDESPLP